MRDWGIDPKLLCRSHLLGSHFELHKAVGNLRHTGKWAMSLVAKGFLDPSSFQKRHDLLVEEMLCRGYRHNSPLEFKSDIRGSIDLDKAREDLKERCPECRGRLGG